MEAITGEMMADIDKKTVEMVDNYDGREKEPSVLPSAIPNLLVNGSYGIAVGMATSCPPHNLTEVCDAIVHHIDNPECTPKRSHALREGPRLPHRRHHLRHARASRTPTSRAVAAASSAAASPSSRTRRNSKVSLIVQELPYQVNKLRLIESIAQLVREKVIEGITDLRDESDKDGMRLVIEIRKGDEPEVILNQLYKHTQMQATASIIFLSLVNNMPRVLNLRDMIYYYVEHRAEIVERRTRFDLDKAEARAHILEGLLKAIDHIDEVIEIIRSSPTRTTRATDSSSASSSASSRPTKSSPCACAASPASSATS
jgi:DNA gyrase subunit A